VVHGTAKSDAPMILAVVPSRQLLRRAVVEKRVKGVVVWSIYLAVIKGFGRITQCCERDDF